VLIGAADYRFLGFAAFGYFAVMIPIALIVLNAPNLGINGVWGGIAVWMLLRALVNNRRTNTLLSTSST
ncbi:MAG: hypothetical protein M3337_03330, partial [Actinomycetota bacterium]|nr:hypothetical protein [Actinomycetota bacterium]